MKIVSTLEGLGKDSPVNEQLSAQSGSKEPGIQMDKSSGHPRHSASSCLHFAILASIRHTQAPSPQDTLLHRLPHSEISHSIISPFASLPYKTPQVPPSHSCSQQSEASVHSVYSLGACRDRIGQRLGLHLFLATLVPRNLLGILFFGGGCQDRISV